MNEARRTRAWERRGAVAVVAGLTVAGVAVLVFLWAISDIPAFTVGFLCGSFVTGVVAIVFWAVDHSPGTHNDKFGCYGEENTADLFASGPARRAGWEVRHNLEFDAEDVDHVVFGSDGVFAIETKWTNTEWRHDTEQVHRFGRSPFDQARLSARHVRCLLRSVGLELPVTPVVIQWGPGGWSAATWSTRWFDGVLAVRGAAGAPVLEEIEGISGARLAPDVLDRVRAALDARVEGRPSPVPQASPATSR